MKLVIYRDKKTNEIKNYHGVNSRCTEENLKSYNEDDKYDTKAEFVELEEGSVAHYFYELKTTEIESEKEGLRDLQDTLDSISNTIDNRLYNLDRILEERVEEAKKQAVKEFAVRLIDLYEDDEDDDVNYSTPCAVIVQNIKDIQEEFLTELYGVDE